VFWRWDWQNNGINKGLLEKEDEGYPDFAFYGQNRQPMVFGR
jgi:hypothetical protein